MRGSLTLLAFWTCASIFCCFAVPQEIRLIPGFVLATNVSAATDKRLAFDLPKNPGRLRVVVEPCGGKVTWTLSKDGKGPDAIEDRSIDLLNSIDRSNAIGGSIESRDQDDDEDQSVVDNGSGSGSRFGLEKEDTTISNEDSVEDDEAEDGYLFRESGRSETEIADSNISGGRYALTLTSDTNATVRVFVSHGALSKNLELLDSDDFDVHVLKVYPTEAVFKIHGARIWRKRDYRYCVYLKKEEPFESFCQARNASPRPRLKICRHKFGIFSLKGLEKDTKYHVTAFVIDSETTISRSVKGFPFVTPVGPGWVRLPQDKMIASSLNPVKNAQKSYLVLLRPGQTSLMIGAQSCYDELHLTVHQNNKALASQRVDEAATIKLEGLSPNANVEIRILNPDRRYKIFRLFVSGNIHRSSPFPDTSEDHSLRSTHQTCTSIALEWMVTKPQYSYCLHSKQEPPDYYKQVVLETPSLCAGPPAEMHKISCSRFDKEAIGLQNLNMGETIMGLTPNSTYRFDLYITKDDVALSYRTIWVKTRSIGC